MMRRSVLAQVDDNVREAQRARRDARMFLAVVLLVVGAAMIVLALLAS